MTHAPNASTLTPSPEESPAVPSRESSSLSRDTDHLLSMSSFANDFLAYEDYDDFSLAPRPFGLGDLSLILMAILFFLIVCDVASLLTIIADVGDDVRLGAVLGRAFGSFEHLVEGSATAR